MGLKKENYRMRFLLTPYLIFSFISPLIYGQTNICSGNSISVSTSNYTATTGFEQHYILTDNSNNIISTNSSGNFTSTDYGTTYTGNLNIYAVNTNGPSLMGNALGNSWSSFNSLINLTCADFIGPESFIVTNPDTTTQNIISCLSYTWPSNNITYTNSGNYSTTLTNALGCDSTILLNLTIDSCIATVICSGDDIIQTASNFNSSPGFQQHYILVDTSTNAIINFNNTGTFTSIDYGATNYGTHALYALNTSDLNLINQLNTLPWNTIEFNAIATCADIIGPKFFTIDECCDLSVSLNAFDETCSGTNDGYVSINITGSALYNVSINGVDSLINVNQGIYSLNNIPNGTHNLQISNPLATVNCDTSISFTINPGYPTYNSNFDTTLCFGEFVNINGTIYNGTNNSGTEVFTSINGCDSIINITITELNALTSNFDTTLCNGESVTINGTTYNGTNNNGSEIFTAISGCDSIVNITITELNAIVNNFDTTLCFGQNVEINGIVYDGANPNGTEIFTASTGCDSTLNITITELNEITNNFDTTLCYGDSIIINGTTYDGSNPNGTELFTSSFGCDSTLSITISELNEIISIFDTTLCYGDSIIINGTAYHASNNSGSEVLISTNGCDSTLIITVSENPEITYNIDTTICSNQEFVYNNVTYNSNNTSGTAVFNASNGCDSTVFISLSINTIPNVSANFADTTVCEDDTIVLYGIGANTYSWNNNVIDSIPYINPIEGTYTVTGIDSLGCQNTYQFDLSLIFCQREPYEIMIPNVFTPNHDGNNDLFKVDGKSYKLISMQIFNRWGQLVYEDFQNIGWDGRLRSGVMASPGSYMYITRIQPMTVPPSDEEIFKGWLNLIFNKK